MSDDIAESLRIQMSECDDLEAFTITGGSHSHGSGGLRSSAVLQRIES
jgi:hypothetical protein